MIIIKHLLDHIDDDDYHKAILAKSSFGNNYEEYEIRGDKNKNMSLYQYLNTITPELVELINNKKNNNEQRFN